MAGYSVTEWILYVEKLIRKMKIIVENLKKDTILTNILYLGKATKSLVKESPNK